MFGAPHKTFAEKVSDVASEVIVPLVEPIVTDYLEENPPAGGLTIEEIKADTDIADSLTKKHSNSLDHSNSQDHGHSNKSTLDAYTQSESNLADAVSKKHSNSLDHSNTTDHAPGSDNQDLSGLQPKETGKGLSTNDYTDAEESKLAGIESGANNYTHPTNHSPSIISQDVSNRFVSDTEKSIWNGKEPGNANIQTHVTSAHAPAGATVGADWNTNLTNIPSTFTPAGHNQDASTINAGTLDGDRLPAMSATKKGAVPLTGTPSGKFLKDDNTWSAPTASVAITEVEIDCGTTPLLETIINVVNTGITAASKIIGGIAYKAPTGKDLDELEMDALDLKFEPVSGSFNVHIKGLEGYISDKFIIWYLFA
jgi:hypothetical protein